MRRLRPDLAIRCLRRREHESLLSLLGKVWTQDHKSLPQMDALIEDNARTLQSFSLVTINGSRG